MNLNEVSFAILAGGRGQRLGGTAKGLLELDGQPIIDRLVRLGSAMRESFIVANDGAAYSHLPVRLVPDVRPGFGAPGGVVTALRMAKSDWVLVTACDMPFVSLELAQQLAMVATRPDVDVACFTRNGQREPLFALYRAAMGDVWGAQLDEQPSLKSWLEGARVADEPLRTPRLLDSLNTPADLQRHRVVRKF